MAACRHCATAACSSPAGRWRRTSHLRRWKRSLLAEIERIKTTPPTAAELARARRQELASTVYDRDSITAQANELGEAATVTGDPGFTDKFLAKLDTVTPDDISRVAKLYLTEDNRTVGTFLPNKPGGGGGGSCRPDPVRPHAL